MIHIKSKTYQAFLKMNIDLANIGIEMRSENIPYFCTPKGADIIGWAGVDGIHFCFIRGFGETVFSVSPMNTAPHFVHPLAKNFSDFLRLLLACGDSAALEQTWQWSEVQFSSYLEENHPVEEQLNILSQLSIQTKLAPMQNPWQYITQLQAEFDYGKIRFTEDYYDPEMNPCAPQEPPKWEVCFDGSFWGHGKNQRAGKEITVNTQFDWAGHHWIIPSIYACTKGLVVDFCMRVEPDSIRTFIEKWSQSIDDEPSREQEMLINSENPLCLDFNTKLRLNGKVLMASHGYGITYNPCFQEEYAENLEAKWAVEHYGLDSAFGWVICRSCYPWATKSKPTIKSLSLTMIQQKISIPGPHFHINAPGDTFSFTYPDGQTEYTLTVREYEAQTFDANRLSQNMECPMHLFAMTYIITPELPDGVMTLADCADADRPKQRQPDALAPTAINDAAVIGIIGGADGPTAITFGQKHTQSKPRVAFSYLHFEPATDVEWYIIFHEKPFDDMTTEII